MPQSNTEPSAKRPVTLPARQWVVVAALALCVLVAVGGGLWQFDRHARDYLREALGTQLQDQAVGVASTIPGDSLAFWALRRGDPQWQAPLLKSLGRIRQDNELANIFLCLPGGEVVLDVNQSLVPGRKNPFLALDPAEIEAARSGIASHSRLYHALDDRYYMTGYAPIFDLLGEVAGFVGVDASVGYFDALSDLRRNLMLIGGTVVALVALLMILWVIYAQRLARARTLLLRNETLSAMGRMTAGIAHEIRNPLGIIKNTAQLLKEDLVEQGVDAAMIDYIPEEVDRLNEILTGYLDFARQAPAHFSELDLVKLLQRTLRLLQQDFQDAKVTVRDTLSQYGEVSIEADTRRLQQVFLNLFLNALQAMPDGGTLEIEIHESRDSVTTRVLDTGVGLSEDEGGRVFEPFVTTKDKGSGLGLSVVRRIVVEDHGGRVKLESRSHRGAVATVILPRRQMDRSNLHGGE
jgi:signal transduction histidine kinase